MTYYSKTVAVTGASRGFGLEVIKQFSEDPNTLVFGLARDPSNAKLLDALAEERSNVKIIKFDVVDLDSIRAGATKVASLSGGSLDILVNNSGIHPGVTPLLEESSEVLLNSININNVGMVSATQAFLPLLKNGKEKTVINLASSLGSNDFLLSPKNMFPSFGAYSFTKGGVVLINTILTVELRPLGFKVLAYQPGWMKTDMGNGIEQGAPPLTPAQSVDALLGIISTTTSEDSGKFFAYEGAEVFIEPF